MKFQTSYYKIILSSAEFVFGTLKVNVYTHIFMIEEI